MNCDETSNQHIDMTLLWFVVILMLVGLFGVFSSTIYIANLKYNSEIYFLSRHLPRVLFGFTIMIFFAFWVDYSKLRIYAPYIFIVTLISLLLVLIFGREGAKRWLQLGPLSFQVSEFAKIGVIIYLAYLLERNRNKIRDFKSGFLPLFGVVTIVLILVSLQKSFTMPFLIASVGVLLIFLGGAKFKHLVLGILASLPALVFMLFIETYRFRRLLAYINFDDPANNTKHQALQALIGLGTGGLFGVGPGHSRQREFYLPLAYNDYIFSILGEEYGLIGSLILLFIFFVVFYRGIRIARYAVDEFGKFLAAGITFSIFLTAIIHIAVVLRLLPPTGIPLPFVSYGGSAMIANCIGVGILLNISKQIKH